MNDNYNIYLIVNMFIIWKYHPCVCILTGEARMTLSKRLCRLYALEFASYRSISKVGAGVEISGRLIDTCDKIFHLAATATRYV
jgi:dolichyl-phosphate-mannose--protein O-mannosyl transferase